MGIRTEIKIGEKFGRWTVLKEDDIKTSRTVKRRVICECSCGAQKSVSLVELRRGSTTSCGCFQKENASKQMKTHGMKGTPEYYSWESMRQRCHNPKHKSCKYYGGRGIGICDEWEKFENFFKDMGFRPKGKTLDRIDNSKGYSKDNCKWSTFKEQSLNRRNNHIITFRGESLCESEWSERMGIGRTVIKNRIKSGWSEERALTTPLVNAPIIISWQGKTMNVSQWGKLLGISSRTLWDRLKKQGLSLDKVFKK
jgi:hypothetical protein